MAVLFLTATNAKRAKLIFFLGVLGAASTGSAQGLAVEFLLHYNSCAMKKFVSIVWLAIVCAGCSFSVDVIEADAPTEFVVTSTLPPSPTSKPSETPLPPPPTGTVVPAAGTTSTQVNVRVEPSTSSEVVGIIPENTNVEIIGKDPGGNWWLIKYPQGGQAPEGEGWVTAEFVVTAGEPAVPVVGGAGVNPNGDNMAIIQQQLNVRSGPGTNFNAIGALNAQDVVTLTGKDAGGVWLQIAFAAGPDGKGWVNAAFAQADVSSLPIVSDAGQVIGTGAPENTAVPAEPTVAPAALDNDSAVAPAVNITLTAGGMRSFQYSSDVSSPHRRRGRLDPVQNVFGEHETGVGMRGELLVYRGVVVELFGGGYACVREDHFVPERPEWGVCGAFCFVAHRGDGVYEIHLEGGGNTVIFVLLHFDCAYLY